MSSTSAATFVRWTQRRTPQSGFASPLRRTRETGMSNNTSLSALNPVRWRTNNRGRGLMARWVRCEKAGRRMISRLSGIDFSDAWPVSLECSYAEDPEVAQAPLRPCTKSHNGISYDKSEIKKRGKGDAVKDHETFSHTFDSEELWAGLHQYRESGSLQPKAEHLHVEAVRYDGARCDNRPQGRAYQWSIAIRGTLELGLGMHRAKMQVSKILQGMSSGSQPAVLAVGLDIEAGSLAEAEDGGGDDQGSEISDWGETEPRPRGLAVELRTLNHETMRVLGAGQAWFRKMRRASPPVLAPSACVESVKHVEKGVGVVEDHEEGYLSSEQIRALVFEEQREVLENVLPEINQVAPSESARLPSSGRHHHPVPGHPWTPNQAMHSPLTDAADAQSAADGSPTSPEREGHQGYGHRSSSQNDFFSKRKVQTRKGTTEKVDLSELERMQQISDDSNLKLSSSMGMTNSTTTRKPDYGQAGIEGDDQPDLEFLLAPQPAVLGVWSSRTSLSSMSRSNPPTSRVCDNGCSLVEAMEFPTASCHISNPRGLDKHIDRLRPYQTHLSIKNVEDGQGRLPHPCITATPWPQAVKAHVGPSSSPPFWLQRYQPTGLRKPTCVLAKGLASEPLSRWLGRQARQGHQQDRLDPWIHLAEANPWFKMRTRCGCGAYDTTVFSIHDLVSMNGIDSDI
ncbi:hypothetical protein BKA70DRAFT_1408689 [Coprinopsis sp. MPI-PUGE-AT-0042]|nr:hypothetical protein BKA70DRAFT_1408689 [Coprinopsis sp. MPI-PUGE-AT-0042]